MIKRIFALLLLSFFVASCSKGDIERDAPIDDGAISFAVGELTADWGSKAASRGVAVDDVNTMSSIMVYSFLTEPDGVANCYIDHKAATKDAVTNVWSFDPAYYYPMTESLDFLAYTPMADLASNGLTQELDFNNKTVKFKYSTPLDGRTHPDLMLAAPVAARNQAAPLDELSFSHALTQVSMSAKVETETETERYVITGFTFGGITTEADMTYSLADGRSEWTGTRDDNFIVMSMLPDPDAGETQVKLTNKYKSIMSNGHTLFMIPQAIEAKSVKPTIKITIHDTESDLTYRTAALTLPSPNGEGWKAGQHVNLQFSFNANDENLVIPMTLTAKLIAWIPQEIDENVDANIYAFLSEQVISGSETTIKLYTNGTKPGIVEYDGEVITAASFGAESPQNCYPLTITTGKKGAGYLKVQIPNSDGKAITKQFNITVE